MRGYESRTVSPKVKYHGDYYEYGGETSFNNSVEMSFPIIDRVKMRGVIFYDYGMISWYRHRVDNSDRTASTNICKSYQTKRG